MAQNINQIRQYLEKDCSISNNTANEFLKVISTKQFDKGSIFVKKDKLSTSEFILLEGICRSFITDQKGDEITLSFFTPNSAISPCLVRTNSNKSILNIQALTDIKVATFLNKDLMSLMNANQEIRNWGNHILQTELIKKVNKEITQISMPAKERLQQFREIHPLLENQIPHSYIASFLGITTVSLSRLRKELMKK